MYKVICMLRLIVSDEILGKCGQSIVCLLLDMTDYEAVNQSFTQTVQVFFDVIESHNDALGIWVFPKVITKKKDA